MFFFNKKARKTLVIENGPQKIRYGHSEIIGKRPTMEDVTVILDNIPTENYSYFAVFDGHGGRKVSHYLAKNVHEHFSSNFSNDGDILKSLNDSIQMLNKQVVKKWKSQGSVIGVIIVSDEKIYSYNIGDVRAVMIYPDGKVERISHDHRAADPQEAKNIVSRGGFVRDDRLNGILEISRTLGDGNLKKYINTEPFTDVRDRVDGAKIILACDGVWDVMGDPTAAKIVREIDNPEEAARLIVDHAVRNHTTDNVSCIVIDLTHL